MELRNEVRRKKSKELGAVQRNVNEVIGSGGGASNILVVQSCDIALYINHRSNKLKEWKPNYNNKTSKCTFQEGRLGWEETGERMRSVSNRATIILGGVQSSPGSSLGLFLVLCTEIIPGTCKTSTLILLFSGSLTKMVFFLYGRLGTHPEVFSMYFWLSVQGSLTPGRTLEDHIGCWRLSLCQLCAKQMSYSPVLSV